MSRLATPVAPITIIRLLPQFIRRKVEHRPGLVKILDNIGWLFFDKVLRMGVGLLLGVWVARYLGPEQFGHINYAMAFVGLFGAIAGLGLNEIVVRDIVKDPENANTTLCTAFVLQVLGGLLAVVLIIGTMALLRPDDAFTQTMVAILSFSLIFKSTEVIKYWFESQVQSRYTVLVENGVFLVLACVKVVMILKKASLMSFVWLTLVEAVLISFGLVLMFAKQGGGVKSLQPRMGRAVRLLKDCWPLILSSVAIVIYMRIDQVMLGQMVNAEVVGVYSAAARLSEVWYFIPMAIVSSVFPAIIKAKSTNESLYIRRLQSLYNLLAMISISVALLFSLSSNLVVKLLYGDVYIQAAEILTIQIWAGVFVAMGVARGKWLLAENLQHVGYWYVGIAMIVNVFGNLLMIPIWGAVGAAYATVLAQATAAIIAPYLFKRTRVSSIMLLNSLNPLGWLKMLSVNFFK